MSSPDSAHPEKSARHFTSVLSSPSFWTLPQPQSPSAHITCKNEASEVCQPSTPRGTASSDDEDYLNLPDNSDSATKEAAPIPSSRVAFSTPMRAHFPLTSHASFQASRGLPLESESHSIHTLLGEVKSAVIRLHEDLSLVIQELAVINSRLGSLSGSSPPASETLQDPQSSQGSPDPI